MDMPDECFDRDSYANAAPSHQQSLIRLTDTVVVNPRMICSARRVGIYTYVILMDSVPGCPEQIPDEDMRVWNAIIGVTR